MALTQGSSYSLASQMSRQYNPPQARRSASRHEISAVDDNNSVPADRTQSLGQRRLHGKSSNRRRSTCSRDDNEGAAPNAATGTGARLEGSYSRRSSSSKSNQDTGFASSPSTPRREDSQTRFSADASPSRYGISEDGTHQRLENGRRRRRSNLVSNNSLDVPGVSLRKEQSLSSSGRGDSSFEEPAAEHHPEGRRARHATGARNQTPAENSVPLQSGDDSNKNIDSLGESVNADECQAPNTLDSKDTAISSSGTSCSSTTLNKDSYDSAKALSSSTSTLKGATYTSKPSIAGSISSLFGRNTNDGQPPQSVGDRWRRLKQDLMPDNKDPKSITDSGKEKAAAIFSAAASKLMSSFPGMSAAFPNIQVPKTEAEVQKVQRDTLSSDLHIKENGIAAPTRCSPEDIPDENRIKGSTVSLASSLNKLPVPSKSGDSAASLHSPTVASSSVPTKPGPTSSRLSAASLSNVSTSVKTPAVSPGTSRGQAPSSHRPSIVSTELSSHERRANVYAAMTERASDGSDQSDSEDSGQMVSPLVCSLSVTSSRYCSTLPLYSVFIFKPNK